LADRNELKRLTERADHLLDVQDVFGKAERAIGSPVRSVHRPNP
jgi:hypothetical protein